MVTTQVPIDLSVVIPAFNEERRLGETLRRVLRYLGNRESSFEVVVADDGSSDATSAVAGGFAEQGVSVIRLPENRGKGAALRKGVLATRGDWVLISDADLSTPIEDLEKLESRRDGADLLFGSRALADSQITRRQAIYREAMGKTFNLILRALGMTRLRDTQCGFKLIRGPLARSLFEQMTVERFAFDVELLWLAGQRDCRVVEVGVTWHDSPASKVHALRDSLRMFLDVLRIRFKRRP